MCSRGQFDFESHWSGCCGIHKPPLNTLFWSTSFMVELLRNYPGHCAVLQHCMHGGSRDKKSKFWSHNPGMPEVNMLESLGILCDKSHQHKSWKPRLVDGKLFFLLRKKLLIRASFVRGWPQFVWMKRRAVALTLARVCNSSLQQMPVLASGTFWPHNAGATN